MRKKLLIFVSALLMLFGSALSVSAENISFDDYAYCESTGDITAWAFESSVNGFSVKWDDKGTVFYFYNKNQWYGTSVQSVLNDGETIDECLSRLSSAVTGYTLIGSDYSMLVNDSTYYYLYSKVCDAGHEVTGNTLCLPSYDLSNIDLTQLECSLPENDYYARGFYYVMSGLAEDEKIDDGYNNMIEDETFGLTGFTADNTITASWTGTTHDDVIDTYNQAKVGIRPGYAYKSAPGQIAIRSSVLEEYDIADMTFTKLYADLKHKDDSLFLRYLEVIPNYQKAPLSAMYIGKSCFIWLNADGSVEKIENEFEHGGNGSSDTEYNSDFYLINVKGFAESISEWLNDPTYYIQWRGTSMDDELLSENVEPDDTSVLVYCIGVSDSGVKEQYDYFALDPVIDGLTIWQKLGMITNTANEFEINLDAIEANMLKDGLTFEGEFYLIPQYKKDSRQYVRGCKTSVNIFTGEVNNIIEEPDEDDVIVPITPPSEDDDEEDDDDSGLPDVGGISDIPTFMLGLIKSFFGFVGYVPNLLAVIFPFLPTEVNYLLSIGLVVSVILRIVGR